MRPIVTKVADGYTGRRPIVEDARCNKCHQELGAFTRDAFHGGQRNDGTTCSWCHRPNQTSSGWSGDSTSFIHSIHAGNKREHPFTWHAEAVGESFADIKFPGVLKNCEGCHVRGAYDFSNPASQDALPNRLYRTVATGFFALNVGDTVPTYSGPSCTAGTSAPQTDVGAYSISPFVMGYPTNYGTGFSYNTGLTASSSCTTDGSRGQQPARRYFAGGYAQPGEFADRDGVFLVPRLGPRPRTHSGQHWLHLLAARHRARHDGDLPHLPWHGTHRRHQGHAREVAPHAIAKSVWIACACLLLAGGLIASQARTAQTEMKPRWKEQRPRSNPHLQSSPRRPSSPRRRQNP